MAEENSSQEKPDYKHFKQEEAPREPEGPQSVEGETALDSEGATSTDAEQEEREAPEQTSGSEGEAAEQPKGPEAEAAATAPDADAAPEEPTNDVKTEDDEQKRRELGKTWLRQHVRQFGIGIAAYLGITLIFFVIAVAGTAIDHGGPITRFGLAGTTLMMILAPVALIAAAALIAAILLGKLGTGKITKSRVLIAGATSVALVLVSSIGLAQSPLTCQHIDKVPATCTEPETCSECGEVTGDPLGHDWADATCTEPQTCKRCGTTQGVPAGHTPGEWTVVEPASCNKEGTETTTCTVCGEPMTQTIPTTEHTPGDMVTVQEPSVSFETGTRVNTPGRQEQHCTVCGALINSIETQPTEEQATEAFKAACSEFSYDQAARDPDSLNGSLSTFSGRVVQVMQDGNLYVLRVNKDNDYSCTVYVVYMASDGAPRILEDDYITLWGTLNGLETYTTIFGASVTIPSFVALYVG